MLLHKENAISSCVLLGSLCDSILRLDKSVQSIAAINNKGRIMEEISRPGFTKLYPNHLSEFFCMSCVLQVSMGRDFDENYGPVNYCISERANLTMITIPLCENMILVTADKNTSPITLAREIVDLSTDYMGDPNT
jgi:hypothetical protein